MKNRNEVAEESLAHLLKRFEKIYQVLEGALATERDMVKLQESRGLLAGADHHDTKAKALRYAMDLMCPDTTYLDKQHDWFYGDAKKADEPTKG